MAATARQDDCHEERVYSGKDKDKDKDKDSGKEDRRSAEMDQMGSEVFNLKLALQEYEDRLAKLYQTEDRSKWKGPATLLSDLEVADREVDRLERTVANLRNQLLESRAARDSDGGVGLGGGSGGGGGGEGEGEGEEQSESVMPAKGPENSCEVDVEELRDQIAALEEDNRVLADAAGWELCEGSEGEEEDVLVIPAVPSQRIRVIEGLSCRMKELTLLLDSALTRENDAREAAEDAAARMDNALARTEELEAAVLHYKHGKVSAEGRESALKIEIDELRSRGRGEGGGEGEGADGDGKGKATVSVGIMARLMGPEEASTKAAGVNTEEGWPSVNSSSNELALLEADALRWKEACERTNAQLQKERSFGEETAQRLSEKETMVRELTKRLREAEKAVAAATEAAGAAAAAAVVGTRLPTGVRQQHGRLSFERSDDLHKADQNGGANHSREEKDDQPSFAVGDAAAEPAAAAAADASINSLDSYIGTQASTASTDEDAVWKGRARASADTHKDAADADAARENAETDGTSADGGHTHTSSPCSPVSGRRQDDDHTPPAPKQKVMAVTAVTAVSGGAFHDEEACGEGGQAGHGGALQQQKHHHLQGRPRWASQKHVTKQAGAGGAGRPQQKQQSGEQPSTEGLNVDPPPPGFPASSARRRRRRGEVDVGIGGQLGAVGGDLGAVDDDELSTAECSAETTGGGRDAVGVSFDVASDGDGASSNEDEEIGVKGAQEPQPADVSGSRTPPQPRQGWERWHQQQRPQQRRPQQQRSDRDGWRAAKGANLSSSMQPTATVAGDVSASGGELISDTPRAESAARRAEAAAIRAEQAAESARVDREGAELAAVEADAAAAAAKAALKIDGVPAPSHGYFTGMNALRPQATNATLKQHPPADVGDVATSQSERSRDTESRREARLAERASLMARLEALAAATEAERVARSTTGRRGQIRTGDTTALEEEKDVGGWLEDEDLSIDRLERVAVVESPSGSAAGVSFTTTAGKPQTSDRTQDVDYWDRPVAMAAAGVATKTLPRHASRRHRSYNKAPRSKPSVAVSAGGAAESDLAARIEGAGESKGGAAGHPNGRHRTSQGVSKSPTIPLLSVGRKRLAEVGSEQVTQGSAAVDETAVSQEARRRRVLPHVEVGRGGEEHYRDTAKQRTKTVEDDPLNSSGLGPDGAGNFDNDGGERFSAQRRRSASRDIFARQQGADELVGGAGMGTGMVTGSLRPTKSIKKRKSRPAGRATAHTAASFGSRQALGYVHAHGVLCARRCASPACPCGEAAAMAATALRFRPGVGGTRR
eukprot:g7992.t1